mgnify:CR=1 FL=1
MAFSGGLFERRSVENKEEDTYEDDHGFVNRISELSQEYMKAKEEIGHRAANSLVSK